jgi:alanine racemase
VVKADAYGLGISRIAPVLWAAGCRTFFVAILEEALALRALLPDAVIHVLDGLLAGTQALHAARGIVPVINDLGQLAVWRREAARQATSLPLCLQVDTGMSRFGLPGDEMARLAAEPDRAEGLQPSLLMSHLACADQPGHEANGAQLVRFEAASRALGPVMTAAGRSLAASSGIFLGADFHHDLVRPGAALFGIAPREGEPNPMRPVVTLRARVVQVRTIEAGESVGYGATFTARGTMRIATIATGYADGFLRAGSNRGAVAWSGTTLPIVGLVSMDSITVDASALGERLRVGQFVELIGPDRPLEAVARDAGTIGYEILTSLGGRYHRRDLPVRTVGGRRIPR